MARERPGDGLQSSRAACPDTEQLGKILDLIMTQGKGSEILPVSETAKRHSC